MKLYHCLLWLFIIIGCTNEDQEAKVKAFLERAQQEVASGNVDEAKKWYDKAFEIDPTNSKCKIIKELIEKRCKEEEKYRSGDVNQANSCVGFVFANVNTQGYREYTHTQTGLVFVLIPSGSFRMGSPSNEEDHLSQEGPVHNVELNSYLIAKYELIQEVWAKVMGTSLWRGRENVRDDPQCPAVYITWDNCQKFCKKTSLHLPTEAQWERACRADTSTRFYWGEDLSGRDIGEYAWYDKNTWDIGEKYAHRVGQKKPNDFGLYDMSGNVYEWCQDFHDENYYSNSPASNPTGPAKGSRVVSRGGCFGMNAGGLRSAYRDDCDPGFCSDTHGVRLVANLR